MKNLKNKGLIINTTDIKINTDLLDTVNSNTILTSIFPNKIEGSSVDNSSKYIELDKEIIKTNHFLLMLQFAFNQHKPITISPDNIWLLICQGFFEHIKINSDIYKKTLGVDKKQTIQIRRDDFIIEKDNPWEEIFPEFTNEITRTIHDDLYSNIVLEFSTSSKKEISAFEITFMDSMSSFFNYEFISLCGIPQIEIKGLISDYTKMLDALEVLKGYDLEWWIDKIYGHIKKIIEALEGKNDIDFWNSIYKENNESGGPYITGWIADFFPYLKTKITEKDGSVDYDKQSISKDQILKTIRIEDLNFNNYRIHNVQIKNPRLIDPNYSKLKLDNFPSGISTVPFKWKYINKELDMSFVSGFIGIKESKKSNTLETDINWIVTRA